MASRNASRIPQAGSKVPQTSGTRLPLLQTGLSKAKPEPVSQLASTRVTRRSLSVPDLSKISTKGVSGGPLKGARSNLNLADKKLPATARPVGGVKAMTSTANRKRPIAAVSGPSTTVHGGKRPLKSHDSNSQNARPVTAEKQAPVAPKRKVAAWDIKGQLAVSNSKIEQLKLELENLAGADEEAAVLRCELEECQTKWNNAENDLRKAKEKIKENEGLSETNRKLKSKIQDLSEAVKQLSERRDELLRELANVKQVLDDSNFKIHVLKEELEKEKYAKKIADDHIKDLKTKEEIYLDEIFKLQQQRRAMHNQILDLKGNVRVFCRVRPPISSELSKPLCSMNFPNDAAIEIKSSASSCASTPYGSKSKPEKASYTFTYDKVFPPNASQQEIYEELSQLVQSALDGYNVCIFAYGQTGSGKTYTMEGGSDNGSRGMIPRAVETIFDSLEQQSKMGWKYTIKVSFLEIYNEVIRDLLNIDSNTTHDVKMVEANSDEIFVSNLTVKLVTSAADLHHLLAIAQKNRFVAATVCNDYSSRSHSITQIKLEGVNDGRDAKCRGTLNLIDLAGSERYRDENKGDRKVETVNINKSLSSLSLVVLKLAQKSDHIPFRDSKLTHLLMPSLKGNSKTLMMVNISPFEDCQSESMSSLKFADRVSKVKIESRKQIKCTMASTPVSKPAK